MRRYRHIYGPVRSGRLGLSLGVDLVPHKTCCYDCIYCQQGRTTNKTFELSEYVSVDEIVSELRLFFKEHDGYVDVITLAGSGEPCLNIRLGEVVRAAKDTGIAPVCVLTNGAPLLYDSVREALLDADIVIPTLTTPRKRVFKSIHRPHKAILPDRMVSAWVDFKGRFRGRFVVEVMVVAGYNDVEEELLALRGALQVLEPDEVQLNTVRRPPAENFAKPVNYQRLKEIGEWLGLPYRLPVARGRGKPMGEITDATLQILHRRPSTPSEIADSLGVPTNAALKVLEDLRAAGVVSIKHKNGKIFYAILEDAR